MKRLIIFLGISLILIGIRFHNTNIQPITGGELTFFSHNTYRIDLPASTDIHTLLTDLNAKIVFNENDNKILYAYSDKINKTVYIHKKRVNLMIYMGEEGIVLGVPIIKGSY